MSQRNCIICIGGAYYLHLDTGLATFLAGFRFEEELLASSYAGSFWESHVFGQIIRQTAMQRRSMLPAARKFLTG
jgi:hypothetical protein